MIPGFWKSEYEVDSISEFYDPKATTFSIKQLIEDELTQQVFCTNKVV
jgi:hypothetical protein